MFLSLFFSNNNLLYGYIIRYPNGAIYKGDTKSKFPIFWEKIPNGIGTYIMPDGNIYEGGFIDGAPYGKAKIIVNNIKTKDPMYIQLHNDNGTMENTEYLIKNGNFSKIIINFNLINKALNKNEINKPTDLKKYISIYDLVGKKIEIHEDYDIGEPIKQSAQYLLRAKLTGNSDKLDDKNRMKIGYTGLNNIIIFAGVINNIKALKRTRFIIEQNDPEYLTNIYKIYKNEETLLNHLGLTRYTSAAENSDLTPIDELSEDYIVLNIRTTAGNHSVAAIIDLLKLKNNERYFLYLYDTGKIVDDPNEKGDLGNLQSSFLIFNHVQQELESCWYQTCCSVIAAARYPKIIEEIREGNIHPVERFEEWVRYGEKVKFNNYEFMQILTTQTMAEYLDVGRFGQEFTKSGNRPRMIHQINGGAIRYAIRSYASSEYLKGKMLGTYKSLLVIVKEKGFTLEDFGSKTDEISPYELEEPLLDYDDL